MKAILPMVVCAVFVMLALWHVRMAFGSLSGETGAVPSVEGKPLFVPTRRSTLAVAAVLFLFAGLALATAGLVDTGISPRVLAWLCYALALGLFARAVGEFKYLGFFKRVRGSRFATLDTFVYSPVCLLLAIGVASVGYSHGG